MESGIGPKNGFTRRGFVKLAGATTAAGALAGTTIMTSEETALANQSHFVEATDSRRTVCAPNCTGSCAINARIQDGVLVGVEPGDFPDKSFNRMCLKGVANAMQRVYSEDRIKYPMRRVGERGSGEWERLTWDEAMDYITDKHKEIAEKYGPEANSWIGMTGSYGAISQTLPSRVPNTVKGTNFTSFGIMGDNASNMGMLSPSGVQQEGHSWADLKGSKFSLWFGCNYAESTLNDMHFVFDAIENGMRLVVVDPRFSRTAAKAERWIPIRPGTDSALILGMMNHIVASDLHDVPYIKRYTVGPLLVRSDNGEYLTSEDAGMGEKGFVVWDTQANTAKATFPDIPPAYPNHTEYRVTDPEKYVPDHGDEVALDGTYDVVVNGATVKCTPAWELFATHLEQYTPEHASSICEVPVEDIIWLAEEYATTPQSSVRMSQGAQRYWQGHLSFRAGMVLAGVCGNLGMKHSGFSWSDGSLMRLLFSIPVEYVLPDPEYAGTVAPGSQFIERIATQQPYPVKSLWVVAYGIGTQTPERERMLTEAWDQLELIVVNEMVMTPGAQMADVVLPVTTYYEETGDPIGSWSNPYIQVRQQALEPLWEAKCDWDIFRLYGEKMGVGHLWDMTSEDAGRLMITKSPNPMISKLDVDKMYSEGVAPIDIPDAYYPFADMRFPTPTGRVHLYNPELEPYGEQFPVFMEPHESNRSELASKYPLTLMNCRSVYTAHAQHTPLEWIREVNPEPHLEMSPADADARGLVDGDMVEVVNDRGSFTTKLFVTEAQKPGGLNIRQGWWPKDFDGKHYGDLLHMELNPAQDFISETNYSPYDNLVEVRKA